MAKKESDLLARKKKNEFHILIILMYARTDANKLCYNKTADLFMEQNRFPKYLQL